MIGILGKGERVDCPELTGKDANGQALKNGHQHAHILPLDLDADRHLDHVLIYARMLLDDRAQRAIRDLRRTWRKGGVGDLQLAVVGRGAIDDLLRVPAPIGLSLSRLIGHAAIWTSLTPFVPPRFVKKPGRKNDLVDQINAELRARRFPEAKVKVLSLNEQGTRPLRHFVRQRQRGRIVPPPQPSQDVGFPITLEFPEPVSGPIAIGYASHFGMGLFVAEGVP